MSEEWNIDDAKVLLYLSNKNKNFSEVNERAIAALEAWQQSRSREALDVLLYWIQTSSAVADPIFAILSRQLNDEDNLMANLDLLEGCAMPRISQPELIDGLWSILGSTESPELAEKVGHIVVLLLPTTDFIKFKTWWPLIVSLLTTTEDKRQVTAGLKVWLTCITNSINKNQYEVNAVIMENSVTYFQLLESQVSEASKIALQILDLSLEITTTPILCEYMDYDPEKPGVRDSWKRYVALIEILGIDTSIHQTIDSLPDFAALLSPKSAIPPLWIITLVNVGLCKSNTEGIRVLVLQLVLELEQSQLHAFTEFPVYTARTLFPRFLQTPNFVVINDRCLHAERLREFTVRIVKAFIERGQEALHSFVFEYSQYVLEHAHSFEAPRALIADSMLQSLPPRSLTSRETLPLLAAAKATVVTYTSRAMAGLYYSLTEKLVMKVTPEVLRSGGDEGNSAENVRELAESEFQKNGAWSRDTFQKIKGFDNDLKESLLKEGNIQEVKENYNSLLEIAGILQVSELKNSRPIAEELVERILTNELENPRSLIAEDRARLSEAAEVAFNYLKSTSYELCELAFNAFNEISTRHAALLCYKRSNPAGIPLQNIQNLWSSIKDATLRIIDREFHLEFIDLLTQPGAVHPAPVDICIEIVELGLMKRNLIVPLTRGLSRYGLPSDTANAPAWVLIVMARVFAFVRSQEYSVRLEELIAHEFNIYEKYWGEPESHARAIAAAFMYQQSSNSNNREAIDETIKDVLCLADLKKRITGSYDNINAHRRVIYYQILMLLQRQSSHDLAMSVLNTVQESLESEANPPVRMQAEWLIAVIGVTHLSASGKFVDFILARISNLTLESGVPPRILGSMIRISILLYFSYASFKEESDSETCNKIGKELILRLLPLATSNKAVVRHRAISALYLIDKHDMAPPELRDISNSIAKINESGVQQSSYQNEAYIFDVTDTRLGPVCGGVSSAVFDRYMPNTLLESDFSALSAKDIEMGIVGPCWSDSQVVIENRKGDPTFPELITYRDEVVREAIKSGASNDFSTQIQTKSGTFDVGYQERRTSLIVVATLCDKAVNLGAITRLSDALGAKKLTVRDTSVLNDTHFKTTSLTAEKWIPIEQVTEENLVQYLLSCKASGYTLVGIEQTDTSKKLSPKLQFPEKTLLMMGHERQGIPSEILAILDSCVEIEQLGYVRSMNIQTATAVVVHAYNQNHGPQVTEVGYASVL